MGILRRIPAAGWTTALWALFVLNVVLLPALFGGAGTPPVELPEWMPRSPAALIAAQSLGLAAALPNTLFCLAAGFFFGLWEGMLYASLGSLLGSLAAFTVGRFVARRRAAKVLLRFPRARRILAALGDAGPRTVALTRLSPLIPFAAQNFAWAVTPAPFRAYFLGSLLSVPVGASFFAHLGAAAREGANLAAQRFSWTAVLTILGVAATFLLIRRLGRIADRALAEQLPDEPPPGC